MDPSDFLLIQRAEELASFCSRLRRESFCAVDTEFSWQRTYWPEPSLVQLAAPGHTAVVDVLALTDLEPLRDLLTAPSVLKVFHAVPQDLRVLRRLLNDEVSPVFDTQIGAALTGLSYQLSYADLVRHFLGIELDKSEQVTDWLARPLRPAQLAYAADDVRYLARLFPRLVERLNEQGRYEWAVEDSARLAQSAAASETPPEEAFRAVGGHRRLAAPDLHVLRELAHWREEYSRGRNVRPRHVLPDPVLVQLARHGRLRPSGRQDLHPRVHRRLTELMPELERVMSRARITAPARSMMPASTMPAASEEKKRADECMTLAAATAAELGVERECLLTRGEVESLLREGGGSASRALSGWRREVIGERVLSLIRLQTRGETGES